MSKAETSTENYDSTTLLYLEIYITTMEARV